MTAHIHDGDMSFRSELIAALTAKLQACAGFLFYVSCCTRCELCAGNASLILGHHRLRAGNYEHPSTVECEHGVKGARGCTPCIAEIFGITDRVASLEKELAETKALLRKTYDEAYEADARRKP